MDPTYPLVPVVNILSAVLVSLTLLASALGRSANAGVVMLGIWLLIVAIWLGVDTIVWARDARVVIPVWCKIWAHVAIASDVGVPACSMVIVRRLYNIIYNPRSLVSSRRERIRALAFDICLGMGLPFFIMALLSIIKPVQFVIEEEYGCSSTISGSVLYLVMVDCTSVILPALSIFFYCPKIVWKLYRQTKEMNEILARCNVNRTRYLRGLAVGCLDCVIVFPVGTIYLISDAKLLSTHFLPDSSTVPAGWGSSSIAAAVWRSNFWSRLNVTASMWTNAVLAFVFFALFGLATEARTTYRNMFMTLVRLFWNRIKAIRRPPPTNLNAFKLESKVKKDMTVSPSCASMQGSVSFKEGPIEVQTKRVSRISAAEMDAARFAGSMDDVASLPGESGLEFPGGVAAMV